MDIQLRLLILIYFKFTLFPTSIKQLLLQLTRYSQPSKVLIIFKNTMTSSNIIDRVNFFFLGLNADSLKLKKKTGLKASMFKCKKSTGIIVLISHNNNYNRTVTNTFWVF